MSQNIDLKKEIEDHNHRRYVVSVTSGQEDLVIEYLQERVRKQAMENEIVDFLNPTVNEVHYRKTKKVIKAKKLYPGYVFIKCQMNEKIWFVIRNTPGVRLIVGAEIRPVPLTDQEYTTILAYIAEKNERAEHAVPFKVDDLVTIKDGDFEGMKGNISDIHIDTDEVTVLIEILGRNTPVRIGFDRVTRE
jgi:transcriptional antiterminator NusG